MFNVSMFNVDLRPRVGEFLSARGKLFCRARLPSVSFISTLQRYDILIAVHESSAQKYSVSFPDIVDSIPGSGEFCGIFKFKCSASRRRGAFFCCFL